MDGTIVDTEPYWIGAEIDLATEHGGTWDESLAVELVGSPLESSAALLRERAGIRGTDAEIIDELLSRVVRRVREEGVPWRPGALELLAELGAAGVPCALVTMSWQALADVILAALPADTFAAVVTGDQVTHGKPHPEPYLRAARDLGVDIAACVAIEDSIPGIASAEASGARVLAVPAVQPIVAAPGRSRFASLADVDLDLLRRIVAGEVHDRVAQN
ncbi:HAD family phosphatase [Occultella glacieicola]|uniref:HAD family phosphatase n=2 Tax=Occultella glacieicola TaxID=2518684 RepID=A0ABY2E3A5_9MICO|nr:HAD family phosphatase [Occultella glacieicola]